MIRRLHTPFIAVVGLTGLLLLAISLGCGGGGDDGGGKTTAATTPASTGGGNGGDKTFDVSMTDTTIDPTEFTVGAGATVTFNLINKGTAIHNVRIAGEDNQYNTADDAASDLITGGDTGILKWTTPNKAGKSKFQCDIHPNLNGTITVK